MAALPSAVPTGTKTTFPTITLTSTPLSKKAYLPTFQAKQTQWAVATVADKTATADFLTSLPTKTETPQVTRTPTATIPITITPGYEVWRGASYSSNSEWVSVVFQSEQNDQLYLTLRVTSIDGSANWVIEEIPVEDENFVRYYPAPFHWSIDGKHFYFTHLGWMDGCFGYVNGGKDLYRVNLENGRTELISDTFASVMVLSPDESKLAHVEYGNSGIRILDIETGKEIELEYLYPKLITDQKGLIWSPDGSKLAFTIDLDPCGAFAPSSIVIVDVRQQTQRIIVREDKDHPFTVEWVDEGTILLGSWIGKSWYLNVSTGEMTEIIE